MQRCETVGRRARDEGLLIFTKDMMEEMRGAFDASSTVVDIAITGSVVPLMVKIPVSEFVWPIPSSACTVIVYQGGLSAFLERATALGIQGPDGVVLPDDEVVWSSIETGSGRPGSRVDLPCPLCGFHTFFVEDLRLHRSVLANVGALLGHTFTFFPCDRHVGHFASEGGIQHEVLRCPSCLSVIVRSGLGHLFSWELPH